MEEIKLTVTIEEANQILEALGQQPFKQVFSLIQKIQTQASGQLQPNNNSSPMTKGPVKTNTPAKNKGLN